MKHVTDFHDGRPVTPAAANKNHDDFHEVQRLEAALDRLADLLEHNPSYSPLYERLERELEKLTDPRAHLTAAQFKAEERRARRQLAA